MNKFLILLCLALFVACTPQKEKDDELYLLVGTYTDTPNQGISVFQFNQGNAKFSLVSKCPGISNPSYLVASEDGEYVYACNEEEIGQATSFHFDRDIGRLKELNSEYIFGAHPCYISINKARTFAATANYSSGGLSVISINEDGTLMEINQLFPYNNPDSLDEAESHIHTVIFSPDEKYAYVTDLGKDKLYKFKVSPGSYLIQDLANTVDLPKGSGPRHLAFHPFNPFLYCINELSGTVTAFQYLPNGNLTSMQEIASDTTPDKGNKGSADIHISPDGYYLYSSNRLKDDGIAIFSIDEVTGQLTRVGYQRTGKHPRNFTISPNGNYLLCANRDDNNIQLFSIDKKTGLLSDTGQVIEIHKPACLKWVTKVRAVK